MYLFLSDISEITEISTIEAFFDGLFYALLVFCVIALVMAVILYVLFGIARFGMYRKAGMAGWQAFVPFYSEYKLCQLIYNTGWWSVLLYIPIVNWIFWILMMFDFCKSYGKPYVFGIGLVWMPLIFMCILGFDNDPYLGKSRSHPFAFREFGQ